MLLRTPDERFANLPGWTFQPRYLHIGDARIHYIDEGNHASGETILCLHGEPSWSYLYRKMIPPLAAQHRVIAFDWIGFGRSDKYVEIEDYTFDMHYATLKAVITALDLHNITLVCQDWGGILGLPCAVDADMTDRFARLVIMNTGLPRGDKISEGWMAWYNFAKKAGREIPVGLLFTRSLAPGNTLPDEVVAAYDAPFPDSSYKAGVAAFPLLVPISPDHPTVPHMLRARDGLSRWSKPALVMFSDSDPVTGGGERSFLKMIPTASAQPYEPITNAGHFLQEEQGEEIARRVLAFMG
jgi:haloalkane dehalogenase